MRMPSGSMDSDLNVVAPSQPLSGLKRLTARSRHSNRPEKRHPVRVAVPSLSTAPPKSPLRPSLAGDRVGSSQPSPDKKTVAHAPVWLFQATTNGPAGPAAMFGPKDPTGPSARRIGVPQPIPGTNLLAIIPNSGSLPGLVGPRTHAAMASPAFDAATRSECTWFEPASRRAGVPHPVSGPNSAAHPGLSKGFDVSSRHTTTARPEEAKTSATLAKPGVERDRGIPQP